jgi:ADP-heptose:LPS heptosyltransferase
LKTLLKLGKQPVARLITNWLRPVSPPKHKRFAIFKPDGIGDLVLSSRAIEEIITEHGPENVTMIVSRQVADLARFLFPSVEILGITPGHEAWPDRLRNLGALRAVLRAASYDEVLCLRHYRGLYESIILEAISTRCVILLDNQSQIVATRTTKLNSGRYHLVKTPAVAASANALPRELHFHAAVLSASLGRTVHADQLKPNWDRWAAKSKSTQPFVLIAPIAGRKIRKLPPELVEAAACAAVDHGLIHVVLTGSKAQASELGRYAGALKARLPTSRVEVIHPTSLPALLTLVAKSSIVAATESSIAHMAVALDQHALLLIGGGHFGWFAPWSRSPKQIWLTNKMPCFGCNWHCLFSEPYCITKIMSTKVTDAMSSLSFAERPNCASSAH